MPSVVNGFYTNVRITGGDPVGLKGPVALTAGVDTPFTFDHPVAHLLIQNNSSFSFNVEFDAAATAGSMLVQPSAEISMDISISVIHLLSSNASLVNGVIGGNIVIKGWL